MRSKLRKINRAIVDPLFFVKDPYFLGIDLYPIQKKIFQEFYHGNYDGIVDELVVVAGMRSGKTTMASCFGSHELFRLLILKQPWKHYGLLPDSWIFVTNMATEEKQAKRTIFAHMEARMDNSPFFEAQSFEPYTMRRVFPEQKVECHAIPSSAASQVGSTIKCVLYDEIARLSEKRGDDYAWFVYDSLRNGTKTFGRQGLKISISSAVHSADIIMTLYDESRNNPHMLGYKYKTWDFNPNLTKADFASDFRRDPRAAMRDFGCDPSRSEYLYFDNPDVLRVNLTRPNLLQLLADGSLSPSDIDHKNNYVAAGDPAYRINAFGIALGHTVDEMEWGKNVRDEKLEQLVQDFPFSGVVMDGLYRFEPSDNPISPSKICDFFLDMIKHWKINNIGFDTWQFPTIHERLVEEGVEVHTEQVKKVDFDNMKDLLSLGRLDICNYPFVLKEMQHLILNKSETKVIKPRNTSKDVTDALVHSIKLLIELDFTVPNPMDYYVRVV